MAKNYNWRIKRDYYNLIQNGIKALEVRVGYPDGVYGFELRKQTNYMKIYTLGSLIKNHKIFSKFAQAVAMWSG